MKTTWTEHYEQADTFKTMANHYSQKTPHIFYRLEELRSGFHPTDHNAVKKNLETANQKWSPGYEINW